MMTRASDREQLLVMSSMTVQRMVVETREIIRLGPKDIRQSSRDHAVAADATREMQ